MTLTRKANWLLAALAGVGCAATAQPGAPQLTRYLAKGDQCKQVAELAGTATVIKVKMKQGEVPTPAGAEPESVVGYVIFEEAAKLGWSVEETRAFAKEIWDAPPLAGFKWEILRSDLYYQVACRLATEGKPVRPYATLTDRLQSCLESRDDNVQRTCATAAIQ